LQCSSCKREKEIAARGLCRACYQRWYKRGTTAYAERTRHKCQVKGCDSDVVSHGMCDTHRKRLQRHGHIEETRPDSWGAIDKHPLRNIWRHMRRHRGQQQIAPEWQDDFLRFALDVGERPIGHKLYAADHTKPIGPSNFVWKLSVTQKVEGETDATYAARWQKVYRALNPEVCKERDLKKLYGISRDGYASLFASQSGSCAICKKVETRVIRGKTLSLAVDHCHETGAVRGLLCMDCNRGLGCFQDNPEVLKRAIAYLAR
jgi:hypothetical protein